MRVRKFLFVVLLSLFNPGFVWKDFSIRRSPSSPLKIQQVWTVDTVGKKKLRPGLVNNSSPLITEGLVIQGNAVNGIKAYTKDKGRLLWDFKMKSGVSSPVIRHKDDIYFGAADGFFYSLKLDTGHLNWKFWTGSENSGAPLVHEGLLYWTAGNQKIYALTLKGKLLWIHSGPALPKAFFVRGRPRPVVYKNWVYTGFYQGSLVALDKKSGRVQWERSLSSSHPIIEDLELSGGCLFAPVFDYFLFCLDPSDGKILWKARGGSSSHLKGKTVIYQSYKGRLYALGKRNAKVIWKKNIKNSGAVAFVSSYGKYLIYGSPSKGKLIVADSGSGKTLLEKKFGRGLAGPVSVDIENKSLYFFSIDGYLRKVSIN